MSVVAKDERDLEGGGERTPEQTGEKDWIGLRLDFSLIIHQT